MKERRVLTFDNNVDFAEWLYGLLDGTERDLNYAEDYTIDSFCVTGGKPTVTLVR